MLLEPLAKLVGYLGLAGFSLMAVSGLVFQSFKIWGYRWLEAKFSERMADYKYKQDQELERLRGEVARILDRSTRLHSQEFEVLPVVWEALGKAYGGVGSVINAFKSYEDVKFLNELELKAVLDKHEYIKEHDIVKLKTSDGADRQKLFIEIVDRNYFDTAHEKLRELSALVFTKGIFLEPDLSKKFDDMIASLWSSFNDYGFKKYENFPEPSWVEIRSNWNIVEAKQKELKRAVMSRLWE